MNFYHDYHIPHECVVKECKVIWDYFVNAVNLLTDIEEYEYYPNNNKVDAFFEVCETGEGYVDEEIFDYLYQLLDLISERYKIKYGFRISPGYLNESSSYINNCSLNYADTYTIKNDSIIWRCELKIPSNWLEAEVNIVTVHG